MTRALFSALSIVIFSLCAFTYNAQAQNLFVTPQTNASDSNKTPLFLSNSRPVSNQPLFLDKLYNRTGQVRYNAYQGSSAVFKPGTATESSLSRKQRMAQALIESEKANFEIAMRENERIQREVAADLARQQTSYTQLTPASFSPQVYTPETQNPDLEGKKVIRVYNNKTGIDKPKPVFNSVR